MADTRIPGLVRIERAEAAAAGGGAGLLVCAGRRAWVLDGLKPITYPSADAASSGLRVSEGRLIRRAREGDVRG